VQELQIGGTSVASDVSTTAGCGEKAGHKSGANGHGWSATGHPARRTPEMRLDPGVWIILALIANDRSEDSADGEQDALFGSQPMKFA
jgi:hypothetical protein